MADSVPAQRMKAQIVASCKAGLCGPDGESLGRHTGRACGKGSHYIARSVEGDRNFQENFELIDWSK